MSKPSTPAAIAKVEEAMRLIERAQHDLDRACQMLSPVRRGLATYTAVGKASARIYALWHQAMKLSKRDGLSLDSEAP